MGEFGGTPNLEELIGDALITPTDFREQLKNCVDILDTMDNSLDIQETNMKELEAVVASTEKFQDNSDFDLGKCSNSLELGNTLVQRLYHRFKSLMTTEESQAADIYLNVTKIMLQRESFIDNRNMSKQPKGLELYNNSKKCDSEIETFISAKVLTISLKFSVSDSKLWHSNRHTGQH